VINVLPGQVDTRAWDGCGLDLEKIGIRRDRMMRPEQVAESIAHAVLNEGAVAEEILLKPI
jgi:short-subunit dehydrogenase